jgi:hypothetical protein
MNTAGQRAGIGLRLLSLAAVAFGLLTIKEGGRTLAGHSEAMRAAGNHVPFVLWFNFLAGFAYVITGIGLWLGRRWATRLAVGVAVATAITFAAFGLDVYSGGAFEQRTVIAMSLRAALWAAVAAVPWRLIGDCTVMAETP